MKKQVFTLLIFIVLLFHNLFSQKFRTLEQFQNYYIENYQSIDKIEGVWQTTVVFYPAYLNKEVKESYIAIIKEGHKFTGYRFKDGYYDPGIVEVSLMKSSQFNYRIRIENYALNCTFADDFYLAKNSKTFQAIFDLRNCFGLHGSGIQVTAKWVFRKIFPSESDIRYAEEINKVIPSTGTGFAISQNGHIVTNYHVIENAKKIKVKGVNNDFSKSLSAKVVVSDRNNDLTILKIFDYRFNSLNQIPYTIKRYGSNVGDDIYVLGYPLTATMGEEIKLTNGIISSRSGFKGDITTYQMTAAVQSGNSGAPMFDDSGSIIGVVNAKHSEAENAGYAIKTNYLMNLIDAAPTKINLNKNNLLEGKTLSNRVNLAKEFIYIIEIE